ncbi:MAG TPA: cobyrinate a,c-diamide synthase, partial [Methanocella sp.]|nr:cobyrinate a,c-diamide synthase [Methanocella sp.]
MTFPCIIVAGTHSGCGKTTVASGLMAALKARGYTVQPFKVGPDFIDPSHHTAICERSSRNLDPFMMSEEGVRHTFITACQDADIAIVEGVMGMYDGLEGTDFSSTAHVAKLLEAPVILVVDVGSMSRSANALVKGFQEFDPAVKIAGVIFNQVGGESHRHMIEASLQTPGLGWIRREQGIQVKSRHLGLNMAHETDRMRLAGEIVEKYCDIDRIINIAQQSGDLPKANAAQEIEPDIIIGVAMDGAFCFYYQDNLDR